MHFARLGDSVTTGIKIKHTTFNIPCTTGMLGGGEGVRVRSGGVITTEHGITVVFVSNNPKYPR